ncbi:MAG: hypothetical protein K2X27_16000, partial [Candidatus Obscuribacterales bacterium]|nr:hypothetical protein [Candidatus Obscuribacterales bacterium]
LEIALETDFSQLIELKDGALGTMVKVVSNLGKLCGFCKREKPVSLPDWKEKPYTGLCGTAKLGEIIEKYAAQNGFAESWPKNYATLATLRDGSQVVFDVNGVKIFGVDRSELVLSDKASSLPMAVRASATIPTMLAAVAYKGLTLYDGAMSRDGLCPIGVLIRSYGADPRKILACRVGEDSLKPVLGYFHRSARVLWSVHPHYHWGPETRGVMEFRPAIDHVHTLKFELSRDEKWLAILVSFEACLQRLALAGLLQGERLELANALLDELGFWRDAIPSARKAPVQAIAENAEKTFREFGIYQAA